MKNIVLVLFMLLFAGCNRTKSEQSEEATMPGFTFYTITDSTAFTENDILPGKKSIIILFDTGCSHCQSEIDSLGKHYNDFKKINFYLVSFDAKSEILKFMTKYGSRLNGKKNVIILQDTAHEFIPKFKPTKLPAMYVYSEDKKLIKSFAGQKKIEDVVAALTE